MLKQFSIICLFVIPISLFSNDVKELKDVIPESFSGVIYAFNEDGTVAELALGFSDKEREIPNSLDKKFQLASLSKQFTAAGILLLRDEGLLNINDSVTDYLSFEMDSKITLKHLLTQTSGIPDYIHLIDKNMAYSPEEVVEMVLNSGKKMGKVGDFFYSNTNYILLGLVIESITGMTFKEFMHKRIFNPLKMNDSGVTNFYYSLDNISIGYNDIKYKKRSRDMLKCFSRGMGDAGIYSTAENLSIWVNAITGDFLSKESQLEMFSKQEEFFGMAYGYGWFISSDMSTFSHPGYTMGFLSSIYIDNKTGLKVIVLYNLGMSAQIEAINNNIVRFLTDS